MKPGGFWLTLVYVTLIRECRYRWNNPAVMFMSLKQPTLVRDELNDVEAMRHRLIAEADSELTASSVVSQRINPARRAIAFVLDFFAFSWLAATVGDMLAALPFLSVAVAPEKMLSELPVILLLLARDWFFEGRGIGKNIFGLQVVDRTTGKPASLIQSVKRNALLLSPFLVWLIAFCWLKPGGLLWERYAWLFISGLSALYLAVAFALESYLLFVRSDGLRISDRWAGTATVPAKMDFSNPFCLHQLRQKSANGEDGSTGEPPL